MNATRLLQNKTSQNGSQQVLWQSQPPHPLQPPQQSPVQPQQRGLVPQQPPISQPQLLQNHPQQQQQQQQQQFQYTSANYTLPGVINYLTSEFTNLERFKIMTNLEKSEMKYKIIQLQCEVNSLKLVSDKQRTRIEALEQENAQLKLSDTPGISKESKLGTPLPVEIPDIDLLVVKKSRHQLTKSMKEIVYLLKIPLAKNMNYLAIPDVNEASKTNELDALVNHNDNFDSDFNFSEQNILSYSNSPKIKKKSHNPRSNPNSLASQYFDAGEVNEAGDALEADLGQDPYVDYKDLKSLDFFNDKKFTGSQVFDSKQAQVHSKSVYESDTETEILDHGDDDKQQHLMVAPLDLRPFASDHYSDFDRLFHDRAYTMNVTANSPKDYRIEVHCGKSDTIKFSNDVQLTTISIEKVINFFVLKADKKASFLVIQKDGLVYKLAVDGEEVTEAVVIDLTSQRPCLESAGLINIDPKGGQKYGLVLNTVYSSSSDNFFVKVFLVTVLDGKIIPKEVGSFNKNFFAKDHAYEHIKFTDWAVNKEAKASPRSSQSTPKGRNKGRLHAANLNEDNLLTPYELKFKADGTALVLNVVNKTITYEA